MNVVLILHLYRLLKNDVLVSLLPILIIVLAQDIHKGLENILDELDMTDDSIIRTSENNFKHANEIINNSTIEQLNTPRPSHIKIINPINSCKSEFIPYETEFFQYR